MQEWYLMHSPTSPNSIGGYENESFVSFKSDAFAEVLTTDIASTVILYDSSLSHSKKIRCIIQNNIADTQLKSMERTGLFEIGTIKAGMYIYYEDRYWLVTGYPGNNRIYEKAVMVLCQFKLKWQDSTGRIIERWCNGTSASKYDVGKNEGEEVILTSNNFTLLLPDDDQSATLDGKRVFIDRDTCNPSKVYEITRSDDILYLYGENHGGVLSFICDKDEFNKDTDRPDLGICNYMEPSSNLPTEEPSMPEIPAYTDKFNACISGNDSLKLGIPRKYNVVFRNDEGKEISFSYVNFKWNVVSDFNVIQNVSGKYGDVIELTISDESYIGNTITLQIIINGSISDEKLIQIVDVV